MDIGSIVSFTEVSDKSHSKIFKKHPDYLIIVSFAGKHSCRVVPCWITNPGYTICIYAHPTNLYVDARKLFVVERANLLLYEECHLLNTSDAIKRIKRKNQEIADRRHTAKIERTKHREEIARQKIQRERDRKQRVKEKRERIEQTYGIAYEIAVINNDRKKMSKIEKKVGYDPRPRQKGVKSGSKLKHVTNPKPCVGGRVSPK